MTQIEMDLREAQIALIDVLYRLNGYRHKEYGWEVLSEKPTPRAQRLKRTEERKRVFSERMKTVWKN